MAALHFRTADGAILRNVHSSCIPLDGLPLFPDANLWQSTSKLGGITRPSKHSDASAGPTHFTLVVSGISYSPKVTAQAGHVRGQPQWDTIPYFCHPSDWELCDRPTGFHYSRPPCLSLGLRPLGSISNAWLHDDKNR